MKHRGLNTIVVGTTTTNNNNNNNKVFSDQTESARTDSHSYRGKTAIMRHVGRHCDDRCFIFEQKRVVRLLAQQQNISSGHALGEILRHFKKLPFFPLAFEIFGPINQACCDFLSSQGHRLFLVLDDPRETSFMFQRLSVAI